MSTMVIDTKYLRRGLLRQVVIDALPSAGTVSRRTTGTSPPGTELQVYEYVQF